LNFKELGFYQLNMVKLNMRISILKFLAVVSLLMFGACSQTLPVSSPSFAVSGKSTSQVKNVVRNALRKRNWIILKQGSNSITAKHARGKHSAVIRVTYSSKKVDIDLVSSENLKQGVNKSGEKVIHKTYNGWMRRLEYDIQRDLSYAL
jgi:hypothetical protein